jgi:uncharacterized protein
MNQDKSYIPRLLAPKLRSSVKSFPVVVLTGARQIGKTTLLKNQFPKYNYVTLDRPLVAEQAESDPESFLRQNKAPLIIDEVQYAPSIFRHLKYLVDEEANKKGLYILTGSQNFSLMAGVVESLVGRAAIMELEGLSALELHDIQDKKLDKQLKLLLNGGFPELWRNRNLDRNLYFDSYVATNLERDVRQVLAVSSLRSFERLLRACALRAGQVLNKSSLAVDVGVSVPTITEWLNVLVALQQVFLLEPWFANFNKRLVKSPKLYFADTGLLCSLLGITSESILESPLIGSIWENFTYGELRKQLAFSNVGGKIYYYRDQSGLEIDFIVERGGNLDLFEAKWTATPDKSLAKNLYKLEAIFKKNQNLNFRINKKFLLSRAKEEFSLGDLNFRSPSFGVF